MEAPTIAGYRCGRLLGAGGMGAVFLAQRDSDGTTVAIKVMRPTADPSTELSMRMHRELELSKTFAHPYLPKILDGGTLPANQGTYIVMEFLDGLDLAHAACRIQVTDGLLRRVMSHIAEALSYIHARGLFHRDVKPANIFLATGDRTVLLDFGLAYASDRTQLTRTGTVLGTVPFMAPEQLLGEALTPATDIYGLGAAAVAAVTGMPPYDPAEVLALVTGTPGAAPLKPPPIGGLVSDGLKGIILRCIAFDPSKRFASADALLRALARVPDSPTRRRDPAPSDGSGPWGEIHPSSEGQHTAHRPDTSRFRAHRTVAVVMALALLLGSLALVRSPSRSPSAAPSTPSVSTALREVLDSRGPPSPHALERLDQALAAADMTARYALPAELSPQARALAWLALKARDEGRHADGSRLLTLAIERCGPFCLASSIHDAPALTLEMARHAGTTALLAEQLDGLAHQATEPEARGRLTFATRQAHLLTLEATGASPEAWRIQAGLLEPWLEAPPPSVRPVEVAVALMTALARIRTAESRSRAVFVMEAFPGVAPDVPPADLASLRHQAIRALTQEPDDGLPPPRDEGQVRTALALAEALAALLAESGDPRRAPILVDVAYGLDRVGHRDDAGRILRDLAASPLLPSERCDVHRAQASFATTERDYAAARSHLQAAMALAPDERTRTSIGKSLARVAQLELLIPGPAGANVAREGEGAVHSAPGGSP